MPRLPAYLLTISTKVVDTTSSNRSNFPKDFIRYKNIPNVAALFKQHNSILAMKYRGEKYKGQGKQKIVYLLSTKCSANMKSTNRRNAEVHIVQKPEALFITSTICVQLTALIKSITAYKY